MFRMFRPLAVSLAACGLIAAITTSSAPASARPNAAQRSHTSARFHGIKANTGTVTHSVQDGKNVLTLSDDFKVPDAPAPHWQIVDSRGEVFLLQRLMVKDTSDNLINGKPAERLNKSIVVPSYVHDIAKVQIWCAFAETLLGETTLDSVIMLDGAMMDSMADTHTSATFMGVKANTGRVTHSHKGGKRVLTLSEDFTAPDAPAPHWQVVDSQGNTYLLQSLNIKGGKMHRSIEVPAYVPDVKNVQMWCAWAEVLLGEAEFDMPVK
jgi:hypothetical protein